MPLRTLFAILAAFVAGGALVLGAAFRSAPESVPRWLQGGVAETAVAAEATRRGAADGRRADESQNPAALQERIAGERRTVIVEAVERVAPSVASVFVTATRRVPIFDDPFIQQFFGNSRFGPSERRRFEAQTGSAVMISDAGEFLTNEHVVAGADGIALLLPDGESRPAEVLGTSAELDLALLRVAPEGLRAAMLGSSSELLVGEWLVAVGYPVGGRGVTTESRFRPTVTVGVVSALERSFTPSSARGAQFYPDMIQTDAAINPGNSGGPLANASGEIVGINTFILSDSGGSQGLGFAIPIERALKAADEMRRFGYVRGIDLSGIAVGQQMSDTAAARLGLDEPRGLIITDPGVAAMAGLRSGDVLLDVDGEQINSIQEAQLALIPRFVGEAVLFGVWRDQQRLELPFTLAEAPRTRR